MQFSVNKGDFAKGVACVHGVVDKRGVIPILSNVKIEVTKNQVILSTTNMDLEITNAISAEVREEGSITVNVTTLYDILKKLPDGILLSCKFNKDSSKLEIETDDRTGRYSLVTIDSSEFPHFKQEPSISEFSMKVSTMLSLINRSRFAMSTEEGRYYLNGIYIHCTTDQNDEKVYRFVSTDGHRLARVEHQVESEKKELESGIIVHRRTIEELKKILDSFPDKDEIHVVVSENQVEFKGDSFTLFSKLIVADYPDYEMVIPKNSNIKVKLDRKSFVDAVDRVSTMSVSKVKSVNVVIDNNSIKVDCHGADSGEGSENISIEYSGSRIETQFNAKFLLELLRSLIQEKVTFCFVQQEKGDDKSPTKAITVLDGDDSTSLFLIMPLRPSLSGE